MFKLKINPLWNISVIFITFFFLIILSSYVLNNPNESANTLKNIYDFFAINFESYFLIISFLILIFLILIAITPVGSKVLVLQSKDTFSYFSWCSMLFATGLGAALLYWSQSMSSSSSCAVKSKCCAFGGRGSIVSARLSFSSSLLFSF